MGSKLGRRRLSCSASDAADKQTGAAEQVIALARSCQGLKTGAAAVARSLL